MRSVHPVQATRMAFRGLRRDAATVAAAVAIAPFFGMFLFGGEARHPAVFLTATALRDE